MTSCHFTGALTTIFSKIGHIAGSANIIAESSFHTLRSRYEIT